MLRKGSKRHFWIACKLSGSAEPIRAQACGMKILAPGLRAFPATGFEPRRAMSEADRYSKPAKMAITASPPNGRFGDRNIKNFGSRLTKPPVVLTL
ncbi:MAG: hypothetical protein ED558_00470 [Oricola sp.]|nr:MAG: hypothetical protein ED558_00470 [Oricola sp.]